MLNKIKGWLGEKETQFGMWLKLDAEVYKRFHDIIIHARNGTTQIDHVVLSKYGIFVIETKNYKGWIFGSKDQPYWTQNLFGTKNRFQNPLRQNYQHTEALSQHLGVERENINSVIFFIGDAELKGDFPPNVMSSGLIAYMKSFTTILFDPRELNRLEHQLIQMQADKAISTKEHVQNLKQRFASETVCPKCGSNLVKRTAKSGSLAGSEFLGCSNFPRCKYIKK